MIKAIVFDLDGTLVDTSQDIAVAINHIRKNLGLGELSVPEVKGHIGSGVTQLMEDAILSDVDADRNETKENLIKYYETHLLVETKTYPGILPLLETLREQYPMAVASNKPVALSKKTINGLGLDIFFRFTAGPETAGVGKPAPDMLSVIADNLKMEPDEILMVGDSLIDIETARNFGCKACAVTWGFNSVEILRAAKPDFIIHSPSDLMEILRPPLADSG